MGFIELLQKDTGVGLNETGRDYVQIISEAGRRMGSLIDDLLSLSHLGRATLNEVDVDLGRLVDEARRELAPQLVGRAIEWRISPLPVVQGDPTLLHSVMINLLSNAIKYTRGHSPALIEIGAQEQNGETLFFVRDNGAGFDMRFAHKLFGVFQRLHRAEEFEGTGIGLASARRIIERHGGRIWAEGEVDRGATFYFTLPQKEQER
jgi:light-regulated signal transduction histidine kinase (bacteriophytochrome)